MTLVHSIPRVSVITPSCNRPAALRLAERWMAAQTLPPDEWIIADRSTEPPGPRNFLANLADGVARATGDYLIFWEDDDYYAPDHLAQLVKVADDHFDVVLVGDDTQRYYHVGLRRWKVMKNTGASLCQTLLKRSLLTWWQDVWERCWQATSVPAAGAWPPYAIDARLWSPVLSGDLRGALGAFDTVVGIKGLPGQSGLGLGHDLDRVATWAADPQALILRTWLGEDAARVYTAIGEPL